MAWGKKRTATFYDKEILKALSGFESIKNVVLDSTSVSPTADGRYIMEAGSVLVASAEVVNPVNKVFHVVIDATSGTYKLTLNGHQTAAIPFDAPPDDVHGALESLAAIAGTDISVAGTASDYHITCIGTLAASNTPTLTSDATSLAGGTHTATVTVSTAGVAGNAAGTVKVAGAGISASDVVGILTHTVEFFYPPEAGKTDEPAGAYWFNCIFDTSKLVGYTGNETAVKTALDHCEFV